MIIKIDLENILIFDNKEIIACPIWIFFDCILLNLWFNIYYILMHEKYKIVEKYNKYVYIYKKLLIIYWNYIYVYEYLKRDLEIFDNLLDNVIFNRF